MKQSETIQRSELCEVYWQAAIMYCQKFSMAFRNGEQDRAQYMAAQANHAAEKVWTMMGFSEGEIQQHRAAFNLTIFIEGGSYESVTLYFEKVARLDTLYPSNIEGVTDEDMAKFSKISEIIDNG